MIFESECDILQAQPTQEQSSLLVSDLSNFKSKADKRDAVQ